MKEPLRLLNDLATPSHMRQVLAAAAATPPLPPAIRSSLSNVAAQLVATAAVTNAAIGTKATASVLGPLGAKLAGKALLVVASLGTAGTVAYVAEPLIVGADTAQRPAAPVTRPVSAPQPQVGARECNSPTVPVAEPLSIRELPKVTSAAARPPSIATSNAANEPEPQDGGSGIAREAKLLERARGYLQSDPAMAFDETNLHIQRFPEGRMVAERELIAVEALLRLGRRVEAERRAAPRLQGAPSGLYAKRLRQILDEF